MNNFTEQTTNNLFLHNNTKNDILELIITLISYKNESKMWHNKIFNLIIALMSVLDEKRLNNELVINTETLTYYLDLNNLITLYHENKKDLLSVRQELHSYLVSLPQLNLENHTISAIALEQHQYMADEILAALKVIQKIEQMK